MPKPEYHSTYNGYEIYHRPGIKRRPWLVLLHPDREEGMGRFAAKESIAACKNLIDVQARRNRRKFLRDTLIEYGVIEDDEGRAH